MNQLDFNQCINKTSESNFYFSIFFSEYCNLSLLDVLPDRCHTKALWPCELSSET